MPASRLEDMRAENVRTVTDHWGETGYVVLQFYRRTNADIDPYRFELGIKHELRAHLMQSGPLMDRSIAVTVRMGVSNKVARARVADRANHAQITLETIGPYCPTARHLELLAQS